MSLFDPTGINYIEVRDIKAATAWYVEKLGLREFRLEADDCPGSVTLGFSEELRALTLGPPAKRMEGDILEELTHMLYTTSARKARDVLSSRGVQVSEIQQDRQGTRFFEMRDLENNVIEITEEP